MADCYPAPSVWPSLRTELTDGEQALARVLIDALGDDWRIYLQPAVGGTRPDVVLVHPRAGIQIIEVKDYRMGAYDVSGDQWTVKTASGRQPTRGPFAQVDTARNALFRILLPFAEEVRAQDPRRYGFVRPSVFLANASEADLKSVRAYKKRRMGRQAGFYGLAGRSLLQCGSDRNSRHRALTALVPILRYAQRGNPHVGAIQQQADDLGLDTPWHEILHGWLHPTPDESAQNAPLELTPAQAKAARSSAHHLLITGPAGSGKTLVLARRVARALVRGKDVLLLSFNITLWHHVQDFVARAVRTTLAEGRQYTSAQRRDLGKEELRRRIRREMKPRYTEALRGLTITHYHEMAYRLWSLLGEEDRPGPDSIADVLCRRAHTLQEILATDDMGFPKADALMIDEGQDWGPDWPKSLQPILQSDASMTVAVDPDQRIYDHAVRHPEALFRGEPTRIALDGTARVPPALLPALNAACETASASASAGGPQRRELSPATQLQLDFEDRPDPEAVWTPASPGSELDVLTAVVRQRVLSGINPSQIAVLVSTHETGLEAEHRIEAAGIDVCSVCVEDPERDTSRKRAFWRLDPRLKLSTVHSFKGWEADVVVALLPGPLSSPVGPSGQNASAQAENLLHVALTRTRAVIEVIAPPAVSVPSAWKQRDPDALSLASLSASSDVPVSSLQSTGVST